jgi:hypothetical protein
MKIICFVIVSFLLINYTNTTACTYTTDDVGFSFSDSGDNRTISGKQCPGYNWSKVINFSKKISNLHQIHHLQVVIK